jgi:hypothetical protein
MVMPSPIAQPSDIIVQPLVFSAPPGPSSVANPFSPVVAEPLGFFGGFGNPFASPPKKSDKCIIRLPFGICLLNQRQGESILGGLLIVAGGVVALTGVAIIVGSLLVRSSYTPTFIPVPVARAMGARPSRRRVIETPDQAPIASG